MPFIRKIFQVGGPVFIKLPRDYNIDGVKCDVVIRLNKSLYGQAKAARLWYEKLQFFLLERGFGMSKVDTCLFMSKTVICVVCVDDCIFWACSQYEIDNVMKYLKEDGPNYNWYKSRVG